MSELRTGFTTGTCAAAAAKAAVSLLAGLGCTHRVRVTLPGGDVVTLPLVFVRATQGAAAAAVRKDAGDDPDVTDGALVVASVAWTGRGEIEFARGEGVGLVTKPGLSVPVGEPAINPVPRRMIAQAIREVTDRGIQVTISIPGGETLAAKTFNPRLGIVGGLSILGTSGRVRPFSHEALQTALKCSLDVAAAGGVTAPVFVPGNIGARAARTHFSLSADQVIEVSNEWGFMLDCAAAHPFSALLAVGHPGKLAKLAAGYWDTHSARSGRPVPVVAAVYRALFDSEAPDRETAEGLFAALPAEPRARLGDALARTVREAISARMRAPAISVVLVNMEGEILGSDGDLSPWRPAPIPSP